MLLKQGVYRHLLFNRGRGVRKAMADAASGSSQSTPVDAGDAQNDSKKLEKARWKTIIRLGFILILIDAFIRWSHLRRLRVLDGVASWDTDSIESLLRITIGCFIETIAFHIGITIACALALRILRNIRSSKILPQRFLAALSSDVHHEFRMSHVPLTLLYSSITKLFLLCLLAIWRPSMHSGAKTAYRSRHGEPWADNWLIHTALGLLDEDKLDSEWVVRNLLGGMNAGFGLRVALDIHPIFTTAIVLCGWGAKTLMANVVHPWVGRGERISDVFLEYSIP